MSRDSATLLDVLRAARLILEFTRDMDRPAFFDDIKTQSAVLHQLLVLGKAVKRFSGEFRTAHPEIPWGLIAGMRTGSFTPTTPSTWALGAGREGRNEDCTRGTSVGPAKQRGAFAIEGSSASGRQGREFGANAAGLDERTEALEDLQGAGEVKLPLRSRRRQGPSERRRSAAQPCRRRASMSWASTRG